LFTYNKINFSYLIKKFVFYVSSVILSRYGSVDTASYKTVLPISKRPFSSTRDSELFVSTMSSPLSVVKFDHEKNYEPRNVDLVRIYIYIYVYKTYTEKD